MKLKCHSLTSLIYLAIVWAVLSKVVRSECPSRDAINPCKCFDNKTILCDGDYAYNLKWVFGKISSELSGAHRNFNEFILSNTAITELETNVFANITFKVIKLNDTSSLRKIASNAFRGSATAVDEFHQIGESQLGADKYIDELFDALSSLVNAKKIWLDRTELRAIASVGFGKVPGVNSKLEDLNFNKYGMKSGFIKTIGNYAFYYLNKLRYLYLSHQQIDYIPSNAFDFEKKSDTTLYIYLGNNRLNNTSLERGIFLNTKRPVHLELYWNTQLTYLDEQIFAPFLKKDKRNQIKLIDNPLECDCKSYWIVKDKDKYRNQIINAKCRVGHKLFSIELITFDKCKTNTTLNKNPLRISVTL